MHAYIAATKGTRCADAPAQIGLAERFFYKGDALSAYNLPPPVSSQDPTSAAYKAQVCARLPLLAQRLGCLPRRNNPRE